jgi:23S rRNA (pseudouridine1915-N3)-methyltransferase
MNISIITIGKVKESYIREGILEYVKRLNPYVRIKEVELKPESFTVGSKERTKKIEGEKILNVLERFEKEDIFLLDENSLEYSSKKFSELLDIKNEIVFVIAGSLGWSDDLRNSNYKKLSLSQMTFPHEIARLLLMEQIYRGVTIIKGKEYHY